MLNASETAEPGSTLTPSQVKKLKIAIAIMSILLVVGFILLLVGISMQTRKLTNTPSPLTVPAGVAGTLSLPVKAGAELTQVLTDQGRLILHIRQPGGGEVSVIDLASGRELQRIRLAPQE